MKKIILSAAVLTAFSFASCKKDKTCSCTATTTSTGTTYYVASNSIGDDVQGTDVISVTPTTETVEQTYTKVSKKYMRENCPATTKDDQPYDNTYDSGYSTVNGKTILRGDKGTKTTSTTCTIK